LCEFHIVYLNILTNAEGKIRSFFIFIFYFFNYYYFYFKC